jgi:ribosomal protein S18 acetylase RimI-like enzyme
MERSDLAARPDTAEIRIREGLPRDSALLAELGARTFSESFGADNTPENMQAFLRATYSAEEQTRELAEAGSRFLIAEVNGTPVGYAYLKRRGAPAVSGTRPIEIARFYSVREWIGRGVGPTLMAACLRASAEDGCDVAWLGVWEHNPRAIAFYRKWGFQVVGSHTFLLGTDPQVDLVMSRPVQALPADG